MRLAHIIISFEYFSANRFFSKVQFRELCDEFSKFWKVSALWMPKQLKPEQQTLRMMCLDTLQHCDTEGEVMLESCNW